MKKYLIFTLLLLLASFAQAQNTMHSPKDGKLKLTIHYLYAVDSTAAADDYVNDSIKEGERYLVVSPVIEHYYADKDTVKGRMPAESLDITVLYTGDPIKVTLSADPEEGGTVSGAGEYAYNDEITVDAEPNDGYEFVNWTKDGEEVSQRQHYVFQGTENVDLVANFKQNAPIVADIEAPQAICAGDTLNLTVPEVSFAEEQGWQMAPKSNFEDLEVYEGQALDASYNGWKLRYYASNASGTAYSNVVTIKVQVLEPGLTGEDKLCSMQKGVYTASGVNGAELTWTVSDEAATLSESGKKLTVTWATPGEHTVTLYAENTETGCSGTVEMKVTVQSFVNAADIQELVAKKHNDREYILIYPNPKDTYKYQWYKDGTSISGANGQYYYQANGLDAGTYKLYISFNADANGNLFGGAFTSEYIVEAPATLSLCPNPAQANEGIFVVNENGREVVVSIYSLDGRLLHQQTVNGTQALLNVSLSKGLYMVNITDKENSITEKLIIE